MIDFRYHLVSIVSIFLALAVGIVLGAGPLQGEIGATLQDEVAGLRDDKTQLNEQLDAAQAGTEARDGYIAAANPRVLAGALGSRAVAVVVLPGAAALTESTVASLEAAGGRVSSTTTVAEDWVATNEATTTTRDAVVTRVATAAGVDLADTSDLAPRDALLASLLARSDADPSVAALDPAEARQGQPALAEAGRVTVDLPDGAYERAALVVVLSAAVTQGEQDTWEGTAGAWVDLGVAFAGRSGGTLLAAATSSGDGVSVVATLRADGAAAAEVSTVDDADDPMGQASIVHGLVGQADGTVGQYGLGPGAEAPFAPVPTSAPSR